VLRVIVCPPCYDPEGALPENCELLDVSDATSLSGITAGIEPDVERLVVAHIDVPAAHEWLGCADGDPLRTLRSKVYNVVSTIADRAQEATLLVYSQVFLDFLPASLRREVEVEFVRSGEDGDELTSWPPHGKCPAAEGVRADAMEENVRSFVGQVKSRILAKIAEWDVRKVRSDYLSATEILRDLCPDLRRFSLGTRILDALEAAGVLTSRNTGYRMFSWSPAVVLGRTSEIVTGLVERVVEVEGAVLDDVRPQERAGASGAVQGVGNRR